MTSDAPQSSIVLYRTEDGRTRIQCRFEDETIWLTQAQIAELFQVSVPTVNEHLKGIFADGEPEHAATIQKFRIVRLEGSRTVEREIDHYRLEAILAVGYRVRSPRGTQFRQWATARLSEYLVKGFTMDDERLKNPPGLGMPDYFDELLERIRDTTLSTAVLTKRPSHGSRSKRKLVSPLSRRPCATHRSTSAGVTSRGSFSTERAV
jgi:hypothetical protein